MQDFIWAQYLFLSCKWCQKKNQFKYTAFGQGYCDLNVMWLHFLYRNVKAWSRRLKGKR